MNLKIQHSKRRLRESGICISSNNWEYSTSKWWSDSTPTWWTKFQKRASNFVSNWIRFKVNLLSRGSARLRWRVIRASRRRKEKIMKLTTLTAPFTVYYMDQTQLWIQIRSFKKCFLALTAIATSKSNLKDSYRRMTRKKYYKWSKKC